MQYRRQRATAATSDTMPWPLEAVRLPAGFAADSYWRYRQRHG